MNSKKILSIVLALLLCINAAPAAVFAADPMAGTVSGTIEGRNASGGIDDGATFTYVFRLDLDSSQDGWSGASYDVHFDTDALEFVSHSLASDASGASTMINSTNVPGRIRCGTDPSAALDCQYFEHSFVFRAKRAITASDNSIIWTDLDTIKTSGRTGITTYYDFDSGAGYDRFTGEGYDQQTGIISLTVAENNLMAGTVSNSVAGLNADGWIAEGETFTYTFRLDLDESQEGWSGASYDVFFDPEVMEFVDHTLASDAPGASTMINSTNVAGRIRCGTDPSAALDCQYFEHTFTFRALRDITLSDNTTMRTNLDTIRTSGRTGITTYYDFDSGADYDKFTGEGYDPQTADITLAVATGDPQTYSVTFIVDADPEFGYPNSYSQNDKPDDLTDVPAGETVAFPLLESDDSAAADGTPGSWSFEWTAWDAQGREVAVNASVSSDGVNMEMPDSDVTVTGRWSFFEADKYYITYTYTGDVPSDVTAPAREGYHEGDAVQIPAIAQTAETEYNGWTGTFTAPAEWIFEPGLENGAMPGQDVTATAEWVFAPDPAIDLYTISYTVNEDPEYGAPASFAPDLPDPAQYAEGSSVEDYLIDDLSTEETKAKDGTVRGTWSFSGWSGIPADAVMPAEDVEITGSWSFTEEVSYRVSYTVEGPVPALDKTQAPPADANYFPGEIVEIADGLTTTDNEYGGMKVVWTFDGWTRDGKPIGSEFEMPEEDVILTGSWSYEEAQKYNLSFEVRGDAPATFSTPEGLDLENGYDFYEGDEVKIDGKAPTDKSLLFTTSEKTNAAGKKGAWSFKWDVKGALKDGKYMPGADTVIVGSWTFTASGGGGGGGTAKYTLTYVTNGGGSIASEKYESGTKVKLTKVPSRIGYRFNGWFADKALKEPVSSVTMNSDKTVYAGWLKTDVPSWLDGENHFAYILGYPNGTVKPEDNITRAEVATIFFRLLKSDVRKSYLSDENSFTDVNEGDWFNTAVSTMAKMGIVTGYSDGSFRPNEAITRAEFTAIAARFDSNSSGATEGFGDAVDHWAQKDIEKAAANGWVGGYEDGSFRPDSRIRRAESMAIINRVLSRNPGSADDLLKGMITFSDNADTSKWYYLDVQEAANGHTYTRRSDGTEKWNELKNDVDWTSYQD